MQNKFRKALAGRIYPLRLLGDRQTFRSTIVTDVQRHLQTADGESVTDLASAIFLM
jgi:hypothetical protein